MTRRSANAIGCVGGALLLMVAVPAAVFGPRVVREASAVVGPVTGIVASEKALTGMDEGASFAPPASGTIDEARLVAFLEIREALRERYEPWQAFADSLEGQQTQSWKEAKQALRLTAAVFDAQVTLLREKGMSRSELVWLEDQVYRRWLKAVDELAVDEASPVVAQRLRDRAQDDLRFIEALTRAHGASTALEKLAARMRARVAATDEERPEIEGLSPENQSLLWKHRARIRALELEHFDLHNRLRNGAAGVAVVAG